MADPVEDALRRLKEARHKELAMKQELRAQLWAEYERKMQLTRYTMSLIANEAKAKGATLAQIGRAYGTANYGTIKDLVAVASADFIPEDVKAQAESESRDGKSWTWDRSLRTVTLYEYKNRAGKTIKGEVPIEVALIGAPPTYRPATFPADSWDRDDMDEVFRAINVREGLLTPEGQATNPAEDDEFVNAVWAAGDADDESEGEGW